MRGGSGDRRGGRRTAAREVGKRATRWIGAAAVGACLVAVHSLDAQTPERVTIERGRFTIVARPRDATLSRSFLAAAERRDTFPGLPRPREAVRIEIAGDGDEFRELIGPSAPEWGAAVAFPAERRIVMQGSSAGVTPGDPFEILRHELAHLALHEYMGDLPPRWFDEGYASYAAGEWGREETLATNLALVLRGVPPLDSLDGGFLAGAQAATSAYALAYRAVAELAALDPDRGLALFFEYWRETRSMERAVRAAYAVTLAQYERQWQQRTRMRYGGLALFADLAIVGAGVIVVLLPLHQAVRRRRKQRLIAMRAAEAAAERAERDRALDELLQPVPPPLGQEPASGDGGKP